MVSTCTPANFDWHFSLGLASANIIKNLGLCLMVLAVLLISMAGEGSKYFRLQYTVKYYIFKETHKHVFYKYLLDGLLICFCSASVLCTL